MITLWVKRTSNQYQTVETKSLQVWRFTILKWEVITNHLPNNNTK